MYKFKHLLIVNKFLCFTLQTGGLVISGFWLGVLIIVEVVINYSLVTKHIDCLNSNNTQNASNTESPGGKDLIKDLTDVRESSDKSCFEVPLALLALFLLVLIVLCLLCIKGTLERNHRLIKPLMIWEGIFTVTSVFSILSNPLNGIVSAILNAYTFVTLYSLYSKLKADQEVDDQVVELPELDIKDKP